MLKFLIKIILLSFIFAIIPLIDAIDFNLLSFLLAITISAVMQYYGKKELGILLTVSYTILASIIVGNLVFLPLILFDLFLHFTIDKRAVFGIAASLALFSSFIYPTQAFVFVLLGLFTVVLSYFMGKNQELMTLNKEIQDENQLQKSRLLLKHQTLQQQQTDAIHLTKLAERNRIARDIHDNIGHSLSRALLQTGAISALNKDENLQAAIDGLKVTLTDSMNVIRNSIHDLKDDAVDLKSTINALLDESKLKSHFRYDIESNVSNVVKNCLLIVLKEALTNTFKHSNATEITVSFVEHPAMYQFLIHDNGNNVMQTSGSGIGIANMKERVVELSGYINITNDDGYKIFITIPKKGA